MSSSSEFSSAFLLWACLACLFLKSKNYIWRIEKLNNLHRRNQSQPPLWLLIVWNVPALFLRRRYESLCPRNTSSFGCTQSKHGLLDYLNPNSVHHTTCRSRRMSFEVVKCSILWDTCVPLTQTIGIPILCLQRFLKV